MRHHIPHEFGHYLASLLIVGFLGGLDALRQNLHFGGCSFRQVARLDRVERPIPVNRQYRFPLHRGCLLSQAPRPADTARRRSAQRSPRVFRIIVVGTHRLVGAVYGVLDRRRVHNLRVVLHRRKPSAEIYRHACDSVQSVHLTGYVILSALSKGVGNGVGENLILRHSKTSRFTSAPRAAGRDHIITQPRRRALAANAAQRYRECSRM